MNQVKTGMGGFLHGIETNGVPEEDIKVWALNYLKKAQQRIHKQQCFPIQIQDLTVTDLVGNSDTVDVRFKFNAVYEREVFEESSIYRWIEDCFQCL